MSLKLAFIGLGVMGYPMAGHLARAGHQVTVWNRTGAKAEKWAGEYGGKAAATPAEAAAASDFVMCCVGNDDDLRQVTLGPDGIFAGIKPGAVFVDHTTASADVARELARIAADKGIGCLDAPVSGGQAGAVNGQLTIMVGGDEAVYDRAEPVLKTYAKMIRRMGPAGSGQLAKMVNQICIAGVLQGLAEGMSLAAATGLDAKTLIEVISKGAAQSWQMDNRALTMAEGKYDFGFAVDWMRKDLGICLGEARRAGISLPLTALVDQFYAEVQEMGGNRYDTSSLMVRQTARRKKA